MYENTQMWDGKLSKRARNDQEKSTVSIWESIVKNFIMPPQKKLSNFFYLKFFFDYDLEI